MLVEAGQDQPEELLEVEHSVEMLEVVVVAVCGKTNHPGGRIVQMVIAVQKAMSVQKATVLQEAIEAIMAIAVQIQEVDKEHFVEQVGELQIYTVSILDRQAAAAVAVAVAVLDGTCSAI